MEPRRRRSISRTAMAVVAITVVLIATIYVDYFYRTRPPPPVYYIAVSFQAGVNSYAVPKPFFGVGGLGDPGLGSNPEVISALTEAGFGWTRLEASLSLVFPQGANNPRFSNLDYVLQKATEAGIRNIILLIDYTPTWLANQSDYPCRSVSHYPPSNFTEWGELAAEVAKHVQSNFHFDSIYYEIWNEPDASIFLCTLLP
jgi:Glycosyl hydrolases family 39.